MQVNRKDLLSCADWEINGQLAETLRAIFYKILPSSVNFTLFFSHF